MAERPPEDPRTLVGRLYDTHGGSLYRYAVMLLADAAAAEDAVQQVFTALLRPSASASTSASGSAAATATATAAAAAAAIEDPAHYLRRAVRNECYSLLRRRRVRGDDARDQSRALLEPVAEAGAPPPDERLALERALRALPAEQREVVHLHVFEGMTFQEIADASSESINTVASRYRYALARLRTLLMPR